MSKTKINIKELKTHKQQNYTVGANYDKNKAEDFYKRAKQNISINSLKYLQKAITYYPYKAKYHKAYAELLFDLKDRLPKIQHQRFDDKSMLISFPCSRIIENTSIEIQANAHYNIYRTIVQINKVLDKFKISHRHILKINLINKYLGYFEQKGAMVILPDTQKIAL